MRSHTAFTCATARKPMGLFELTILIMSLSTTLAWGGDLLKLSSLNHDPESYKLKTVRVAGVVTSHQVNHFTRSTAEPDNCVHHFTVKDDTGSMRAVYATICPGGGALLRNGDHVTVDARFEKNPGAAWRLNVRSVVAKVAH